MQTTILPAALKKLFHIARTPYTALHDGTEHLQDFVVERVPVSVWWRRSWTLVDRRWRVPGFRKLAVARTR